MSGDILIELINTLGELIQGVELMLLNFAPGFNVFIAGIFIVSLVSLLFWIISNSSKFVVIGTK